MKCKFISFYEIHGAPGVGIKRAALEEKSRVFIQCVSQGSRCLKEGAVVLYKVKSYFFHSTI